MNHSLCFTKGSTYLVNSDIKFNLFFFCQWKKPSLLSLEKYKVNSGSSKLHRPCYCTSPWTEWDSQTHIGEGASFNLCFITEYHQSPFFWLYSQYFSAKCIQHSDVLSVVKEIPNKRSQFKIFYFFLLSSFFLFLFLPPSLPPSSPSLPPSFLFFNTRLKEKSTIKKQTTINVNILAVILYYSFERCYYWEKLGEGYVGSLCIISFIYDSFFLEIQSIYHLPI